MRRSSEAGRVQRSVTSLILNIFSVRGPTEVSHGVMRTHTIPMRHLVPGRRLGSEKGFGDKYVDTYFPSVIATAQMYVVVSMGSDPRTENAPCLPVPDAAP